MRSTVIAILAATALLAGCETPPDNSGTTTGAGTSAPVTSGGAGMDGRYGVSQQDLAMGAQPLGGQPGAPSDRVFFGTDQYALAPEARSTLDAQIGWLNANGQPPVVIEGHADERGTREYNLALGQRRAASVRDYLLARGYPSNRISILSYGKERPALTGFNEQAWSANRRAVTVVTGRPSA